MIGLCKKLNIIYNIITCNPEPQAKGNLILLCELILLDSSIHQFVYVIMQSYTPLFWLIFSQSDCQASKSEFWLSNL